MRPATLIPNTVSRTWQPATFISFSFLSKCVSADRLFSPQSHCFVTLFSMCFVPSVIFHTSSSIKGPLINRNPPDLSTSPYPLLSLNSSYSPCLALTFMQKLEGEEP